MEQQNNYRNYEYMTKVTDSRSVNEVANRYSSLGWEPDGQQRGLLYTTLTFKRDRGVKNKEQLNRLQARIEDGVNGIAYMEESKTKNALITSLAIGIFAALMFGGGMSLIMFNAAPLVLAALIGGIALGIVGGAVAAIVYPLYKKMVRSKTAKTDPLIEKKRDEIADLCQEASGLI